MREPTEFTWELKLYLFAKHNKPYLCENASHVVLTYDGNVLPKAEGLNSCSAYVRIISGDLGNVQLLGF